MNPGSLTAESTFLTSILGSLRQKDEVIAGIQLEFTKNKPYLILSPLLKELLNEEVRNSTGLISVKIGQGFYH